MSLQVLSTLIIVVCILDSRPTGDLTTYESRVLDLLRRKALGGVVLGEALTAGPADEASQRMSMADFRREVVSEAHRAGLCAPRWMTASQTVLSVLVFGRGQLLLQLDE
jgi:hypothetical protein